MTTHQSLKRGISLIMGLAAALATVGCATTTTSNPPLATSAAPSAPVVAITYAEGQQQTLEQVEGLQNAVQAYWQVHSQRDWAKLFTMELSPSPDIPLSQNFYVAYHARAWPVLDVKVLSVKAENDTGADILLSQEVRYHHPDKNQPHMAYRHDKWRLVQGQWRHLVNDPMLLKPQ